MAQRQRWQGLIFDLDGTLYDLKIDWEEVKNVCEQDYLERLGLSFAQASRSPYRSDLQAMYTYLDTIERQGVNAGNWTPGAQPALLELKTHHQLAVVTRNSRRAAIDALALLGLNEITVIGREDVKNPKPHPEGVLAAMRGLQVPSTQTIMIGDTYHDVQAAHAANIPCVIVKNPKLHFTPEGADAIIPNLSELPNTLRRLLPL